MLVIRNAKIADVPRIVEIEKQIWNREGVEVFGQEHFRVWLEIYPEGFLVVEDDGKIMGFTYMQVVSFGPTDRSAFTTFSDVTDHGYTKRTHHPAGRYHFGVTMCSLVRGGGKNLLGGVLDISRRTRRTLMGTSRITGFSDYFKMVAAGTILSEDVVALSYTLSCAKMSGGRVWNTMAVAPTASTPTQILPAVTVQDPVLQFYLRYPALGIYAVLPGFMRDPKSRNCSVLFGQEVP